MTWTPTLDFRGSCGNFKFAFYTLTDIKATRSVIEPKCLPNVKFCASTNETDNADVLVGRTLAWTGTCDTNVANEIKDTSETFDPRLSGSYAQNDTDTASDTVKLIGKVDYKDADELYVSGGYNLATSAPGSQVAFDLCPDGNEAYAIYDEHKVQVTAVSANDDGTLFVMG